ncbi:helix-turn-helix transcriptional regulator [Nonomuraea sediminis]|uniref:helix-turn-helix transcriptional regulator n=1 Tax=Nonomuraea sediminis TaxID=2835864 RepID=UPI001BDBE4D5|nr:helix-turn-helix domain-containing protein [Nonomuraea sediminis]
MDPDGYRPSWTFLTHHARVLVEVARDPEIRVRDIAATIGITERAAHRILNDLHEDGYLTRTRVGRRNHYGLNMDKHFRYPTEADLPIQVLVDMFTERDTLGDSLPEPIDSLYGLS